MFKQILLLSSLLFAVSCNNSDVEGAALRKKLLGTWQDAGLRIQMNSFMNSDSISVVEVKEKEWTKYMTVKPTKTTYLEDGTYFAEHRNMQDSLILRPAGNWWVKGDSLFVLDTFPTRATQFNYKVDMGRNSMRIFGTEDSDNDGKSDDDYIGTMKRVK